MKIGIITHNFPSSETDRQNAGIFVYDLAKTLAKKSEVVVFSPGPNEQVKNVGGIKTWFFKFEGKLGNLKIYNPIHLLKFGKFFVQGKKVLNNFLNQNSNLDFIISMWAFPSGFFAYEIFKQKQIPYAIYCLGSDIYIYAKKPLLKNLIKQYLINAKLLIADSPDLAGEVERISRKKTLFLPSASNFPKTGAGLNQDKKKIVLTFLGRLEKVKGVDVFIDALENLKEESQFEVNIIGSGALENSIEEKIKTLNFKFKIKLWGNISSPEKISEILGKSDWVVIPSRSDSIPLVFSESMKLSVPVIVSDLPDLKYLVNKFKVGLVFKNSSSESLVKVLEQVLLNKFDYATLKKNTVRAAEFFDLKKTSDKLLKLISQNL